MNQAEQLNYLIQEAEKKLHGIRLAMQQGDRRTAVQLAAERYNLLQRIEHLKHKTQAVPPKRQRG